MEQYAYDMSSVYTNIPLQSIPNVWYPWGFGWYDSLKFWLGRAGDTPEIYPDRWHTFAHLLLFLQMKAASNGRLTISRKIDLMICLGNSMIHPIRCYLWDLMIYKTVPGTGLQNQCSIEPPISGPQIFKCRLRKCFGRMKTSPRCDQYTSAWSVGI